MRVTLQIPDEIYDRYQEYAATLQGKASVEEVISAQVEHFSSVRPMDRILVVPSRERDKLEQLLPAGGSLRDAVDLVSRVDRLARIEVGEVKVPFTTTELEELRFRAARHGRPIRALVEDALAEFHDNFFNWPDSRTCPECERRKHPTAPPPPAPPEPLVAAQVVDVTGRPIHLKPIPSKVAKAG